MVIGQRYQEYKSNSTLPASCALSNRGNNKALIRE